MVTRMLMGFLIAVMGGWADIAGAVGAIW
jgi:hypothetical protein